MAEIFEYRFVTLSCGFAVSVDDDEWGDVVVDESVGRFLVVTGLVVDVTCDSGG